MSNSMINALNSRLRISGMSSGLDTDTIIRDMLKADRMKIDKVQQNKQLMQWRKEEYRSIANLLRGFKDEYFDILKPDTNMRNKSTYTAFSAVSSNANAVSAKAVGGAIIGSNTIKATQLATAAAASSTGTVTKTLSSNSAIDFSQFATDKNFSINLNGQTKMITITGGAYDIDTLKAEIQSKVDAAFGSGKISINKDVTDTMLVFDAPNSSMTMLMGSTDDALFGLKISNGASNRISTSRVLSDLNTETVLSGNINFKINGVEFNFEANQKTLTQVISEINNSAANVTLSYSNVTDSFTLTSDTTGAGAAIEIENISGDFFGANSVLKITNTTISNGTDAVFELNGTPNIVRDSNTFTIDGVEYTLKEKDVETKVNVSQDVDTAFNKIKSFIGKYNELIDALNRKTTEEKYRSFLPLTAEQKESMKEGEIAKWEEKAKSGLLRNDSILSPIAVSLKMSAIELVDGLAANLSAIGISTTHYTDRGKLSINEDKLKEALRNTPDKVMNLFSQESAIRYSPELNEADKTARYKENGFVNRILDIIQDNIRTNRDSSNKKGRLLEKAGIIGDASEYSNTIDRDISKTDKLISDLERKIYTKEDRLYMKFAKMEKAMNMMSKQNFWLQQQTGGQ